MVLRVYNTMSRKKEVFKPLESKHVKIYTCGQTVYDDLHIGNAVTYCRWDVVVKYLRWRGYDVFHVQNFTDVGHLTDDADKGEDKIEKRARLRKLEPMELVDEFIRKYWLDMDNLNNHRPNISPRATQFIVEMQDLIKKLLDKGYAYIAGDTIYFDTSKLKDYGRLAKLKLDELKAGARVEVDELKKNPSDFALWIKAPIEHLMKWPSPWGLGYPGWHIECSVMSMKYLGEVFDIHGGGIDHIPVHHTNEIAQSEGVTGSVPANYWMHSAFLTINGEKMSKSKGNFITVRDAITKWSGPVLKLALVSGHYRSQIDYSEGLLETAKGNLEKIETMIQAVDSQSIFAKASLKADINTAEQAFIEALDDDFNTPNALAAILALVKAVNKGLGTASRDSLIDAKNKVIELMGVLGVNVVIEKKSSDISKVMNAVIAIREKARKKKDFELSDFVRDELKKAGITIEDTKEGIKWH